LGPDTTTFAYDSLGLVESVTDAGGHTTTYGYDPSDGNMDLLVTPQPDTTWFSRDDLGRVVRRISQVDSVSVVIDSTTYDVMGRERLRHTRDGTNSEWMKSETTYDTIGRPIATLAWGSVPDSEDADTLPLNEWEYDTWSRVSVEKTGTTDSLFYDRANNLKRRATARGHSIRMYYDAASRLDSTVVDSVFYPHESFRINPAPFLEPSGLTVPREKSVFTYDAMGNLETATNARTQVTRTYRLDGLIHTDQLALEELGDSTDLTTHVHKLKYDYDRDRRRVAITHPDSLATTGIDRTIYTYHPTRGLLESASDPLGTTVSFQYNDDGLPNYKSFAGGIETLSYDSSHRLLNHVLTTANIMRWDQTLGYDLRGKVTSQQAAYSGLGYVTDPGLLTFGITSNLDFEHLTNNGLGQVLERETGQILDGGADASGVFGEGRFEHVYRPEGGLHAVLGRWTLTAEPEPDGWFGDGTAYYYDESGNLDSTRHTSTAWMFDPDTTEAEEVAEHRHDSHSYYSADQRLVVHQVDRDTVPIYPIESRGDTFNVNWGAYEEYWYDALGRRVLKRSTQDGEICTWNERCRSSIDRIVWDGDQILWELRQDGTSGDTRLPSGNQDYAGIIGYLHVGDVDAPVSMIRNGQPIILHRNWRGMYAFATDSVGAPTTCIPDHAPGCDSIPWPGASPTAYKVAAHLNKTHVWYGSLPLGQQDESGLAYRRNRYYDPVAGQFTQQDPIGIAGGLNLYGYANGDPINFSDPFGLSACDPDKDPDCELVAEGTVGFTLGSKWSQKLFGGAGLSGFAGLSIEVGIRQTLNFETGMAENDPVLRFKLGAEASAVALGAEAGGRIGPNTSDQGGPLGRLNPGSENLNFEAAGQWPPVGAGVSGTLIVNPITAASQLWPWGPSSRLPIGGR
jgi:RHS repeat-associated protein